MKLTKHQKEILLHIRAGDINDLYTYLTYFGFVKYAKYDKQQVLDAFLQDDIDKNYYHPKDLPFLPATLMTTAQYNDRLNAKKLDSNNYTEQKLELDFNIGTKTVTVDLNDYKIDFYSGVYIAQSFDIIIDFLALIQYLKSEMLILEVSAALTAENVGLFFIEDSITENKTTQLTKKSIYALDSQLCYSDRHYLDETFSFSNEWYNVCKDFLAKKIYPTSNLGVYIQKNFHTSEELMQRSALSAAWLAILVAVLLTFIPFVYSNYEENVPTQQIEENVDK